MTTEYKLAFAMESGAWDTVAEFEAATDGEANIEAERLCAGQYPDRIEDWYVLCDGQNING